MTQDLGELDLRREADSTVHTRAFYALKALGPGQSMTLLTTDDPTLIMESVTLQLRHKIAWELTARGGPWRVRVIYREDVAPLNLVDLLMRDHERLHKLFANAMHLCNAGKAPEAKPHLEQFGHGLRRHLYVEDLILSRAFDLPRDPQGRDPVSMMIREHAGILNEVRVIESFFDDPQLDASDVAPLFALLSGNLAKHENREEQHVFRIWQQLLDKEGLAPAEHPLFKRAQAVLAGKEDGAVAAALPN